MKSSQLILLLVVATAVALVAVSTHLDAQAGAPAAAGPIAVCDILEILNNCQKGKDLTTELNKERGRIEKEAEKRIDAIENLAKELKLLDDSSEAYEQRFAEMQRLVIDRAAWLKFEESKISRMRQQLTRKMHGEVGEVIGIVAKGRGFKIVLHRHRGKLRGTNMAEVISEISRRKVVYSDETIDITASVLSSLNAAYRSKP